MTQSQQSKPQQPLSTKNETWSELKIAWKNYKNARMRSDKTKMTEFAHKIQELQQILGAKQSKFPELTS